MSKFFEGRCMTSCFSTLVRRCHSPLSLSPLSQMSWLSVGIYSLISHLVSPSSLLPHTVLTTLGLSPVVSSGNVGPPAWLFRTILDICSRTGVGFSEPTAVIMWVFFPTLLTWVLSTPCTVVMYNYFYTFCSQFSSISLRILHLNSQKRWAYTFPSWNVWL